MKTELEIFDIAVTKGVSKKTNQPYELCEAQCKADVVDPETGETKPRVGVIMLPNKFKDISAGTYIAEFGIQIGFDKRIGGQIVNLPPKGKGFPVAEKTGQVTKPA